MSEQVAEKYLEARREADLHIARIKARAWDEGFSAGRAMGFAGVSTPNPYCEYCDPAQQDSDTMSGAADKCPACGHMPHGSLGFCPNMASDNECSCTYDAPTKAGDQ